MNHCSLRGPKEVYKGLGHLDTLSPRYEIAYLSKVISSPGDLPNPGIEPRSPTLQVDSLPAEPPGKPKSTGVDSLSLLQGIFPNPGIEPRSPTLQVDSLPDEPQEKPKWNGGP